MNVLFKKLRADAVLPQYQTDDSAGMDVCAAIDEPVVLGHLDRATIPCGFAMAIPHGYEIQVRARSGLAAKHGIGLVNGIGTIDSDYRGELGVILINYSKDSFTIKNGDRIAQIVLAQTERIHWKTVDNLDTTGRGQGGYGSTGV